MTDANASGAAGTTLDAATMRAIRGSSARLALVRAVRDGGLVTTEKDWIEWKSQVNLRDKRSRMDHIVRHILGFANRDPARAARVAEGCAYLLLGVEPGALHGVQQIDPATLEAWLRPYLGSDLRWDADYVELDGKAVLVLSVEAPRWGDPVFPLRRALDPYEDGMIFIRRPGKTERASSAEIDQLVDRAARDAQVLLITIDWWSGPKVITPVEIREEDTRAWVEAERRRILPPVDHLRYLANQSRPPRFLRAAPGEPRGVYEYQAEVEGYLELAARARSRQIHRAAVRWGLGAVELAINNDTMDNYPAVEVQLTFPPTVVPYFYEDDAISDQEMPRPPRPYGTPQPLFGHEHSTPFSIRPVGSGYVKQPSGTIHFAPIDVRPGGHHQLEIIHLVVGPEMAGQELIGEWSATSTAVSSKANGTVTVRVGDTPMSWGDRDWDKVEPAEPGSTGRVLVIAG
jgi:hypothetical protein